MSQIDGLRRYMDAAFAFGQITRARAEEAVHDLMQTGEVEGTRAQEWVENLVSASRDRYEAFVNTVRKEVRTELASVGFTDLDELARRVAKILERGQAAARTAGKRPATSKTATRKATASKATKKAPAKKVSAKKAPAKAVKGPTRRTPAKSAASKSASKTASKKAAKTTSRSPSTTSAKKSTARKARG